MNKITKEEFEKLNKWYYSPYFAIFFSIFWGSLWNTINNCYYFAIH